MKRKIKLGDQVYEIEIQKIADHILLVTINDQKFYFSLSDNEPRFLDKEIIDKILSEKIPKDELKTKKTTQLTGEKVLKSPLSGQVSAVFVKKGDFVKINQRLLAIISMKMENEISSEIEGKVLEVKVKIGDKVSKDDVLIVFE